MKGLTIEEIMPKQYPPRIEQRILDSQYTLQPVNILLKDTVIPFDCYIKRFNGYVIIIKAGTYLSEALLEKIHHNKEIYILKADSEKLHQYRIDQKITPISTSKDVSERFQSSEEKISGIYTEMVDLLQTIFEQSNEKLPLDTLYQTINQFIRYIPLEANILSTLLKIIPDEYQTSSHSVNVACFSVILAHALHIEEEEIGDIGLAGLLHDIGKIRIDQGVLLKPSHLNDDEFETVKYHAQYGYEILKQNGITKEKILNGVRFHHERLDGSGYPQGLHKKLIPKYAKIIGVCDVFDALTTKRTFRKNYTSYEALLVMKGEMASSFDTGYIDTFIRLLR